MSAFFMSLIQADSAPVYWRPTSTQYASGSWQPAAVHTKIGGVVPDDKTYSYSPDYNASLQIRLTGPALPSNPTGAEFSIRVGGFGGFSATATLYLSDGNNYFNLGNVSVPENFGTIVRTIPAANLGAMNISNLYFEMSFSNPNNVGISWAEIKFLFQ